MRFLFALLVLSALTVVVSARPFTNAEGKTIEAEIVRANSLVVTLRLQNKRTATVKIKTLSKADQEYVKSWLADQVPRLRFTPNMVRASKKEGSSYYPTYTQSMDLSVEVKNEDSAKGLEETTMSYMLIGRSVNDRNKNKVLLVQELDFQVGSGGSHNINFRKAVNKYYSNRNSGFSSYSNYYKCYGYVLFAKRKKDGREVYSYASTTHLTEAIYSIVGLKTGDVVDENFQKPTVKRIGIDDDGNTIPTKRTPKPDPNAPIIIR